MKHKFKCQVRWGDLDAFMHVNNAAYLTYIQEARVDFTVYSRQRSNLQPVLIEMVVAHADIDYINPIYDAGIEIDIDVWVSKIGTSSFVLQYELSKAGTIYAKAKTVQVTVSMDTKKSRPINDAERDFLNKYLEEEK